MLRSFGLLLVGLSVPLMVGCAKEEDYFAVFRDQQRSWVEMTEILNSVRDEKTMVEAREKLDASFEKFEAVAKRAKALPTPSPEIKQKLERRREGLQQSTESLLREVARVRKLPGGPEFLKQFDTKYQGKINAVNP